MKKTVKTLIILLMVVFLKCSTGDVGTNTTGNNLPADSLESKSSCTDGAEITYENYRLSNNVWGKGEITDYQQCISVGGLKSNPEFKWEWRWPTGVNNAVKSYPEIIYGWKPWSGASTSNSLPAKISDSKKYAITWKSLTTQMTGIGNLAFDIWLTSDKTPSSSNITREIMIWLFNSGQQAGGSRIDTVEIDGSVYYLYRADWDWTYLAFVKISTAEVNQINLDKFLATLLQKGHITDAEYVAAIEFGNEVIEGSGKTEVKGYNILIQ